MFKSEKDRTSNPAPQAETGPPSPVKAPVSSHQSVIGADLTIVGNLVCTGDLKIDGRVDGDITCRTLTLGAEPVINSKVKADTVRICGSFTGEVRARKIVLTNSAKVKGDLYHESLEIERGASFEGHVGRLNEQKNKGEDRVTALKSA
jgi:cytoskeletal protein CcmA (bactofilin family)